MWSSRRPPRARQRRGAAQRRKRTLELNARAAAFFEHVLWSSPAGAAGRDLLGDRSIDEAQSRTFGVGFAPAGGAGEDALSRYLSERAAAKPEEIVDAGLAHHARGGRLRDRFRHRLVFPIRDERGEVIAFGARALGDDVPKYLNSPETSVYHKGSALYGIDLARTAMHDRRVAVIVEGYFDVMAAHAGGVANTVASSGTALTREQAKVLSRHAASVVLCFDADEAGRAAASRAVDVVAAEGLPARICVLPEGYKDPDELVRSDPAGFAKAVDGAPPEWQVLLDRALAGEEGGSIEARRVAAERAVALLARIPEAAARELYVQQAARRLDLTVATVASDVAAARSGASEGRPLRVTTAPPAVVDPPPSDNGPPPPPPAAWDGYLATLCVHRPEIARRLTSEFGLDISAIQSPLARRMVEVAAGTAGDEPFPLGVAAGHGARLRRRPAHPDGARAAAGEPCHRPRHGHRRLCPAGRRGPAHHRDHRRQPSHGRGQGAGRQHRGRGVGGAPASAGHGVAPTAPECRHRLTAPRGCSDLLDVCVGQG